MNRISSNTQTVNTILLIALLLAVLVFTNTSQAQDTRPSLSADRIEHYSADNTYNAIGNVKIVYQDSTLTAEEMTLNGNTYDVVATGNVTYRDPAAVISADRIELNLKTKLGTVYNSYIFYREHNFHLRSSEIKKVGERSFSLDRATITTCDGEEPDWHISGKDISVIQHEKIEGWSSTFNIKNIPVLYTPYFWAPLNRDRQSGFLFPSFGYSSERGYYYKQGFFWAAKHNQDITLYLDYYDEKGLGEGIDYRYLVSPSTNGEWWAYHVKDKDPDRDLGELKAYHNQSLPYNISGYLKLHAVTDHDYYEAMDSTSMNRFGLSSWDSTKFGLASEERLQKYLESNAEISKPLKSGRLYLIAQGRQSLEGTSKNVPQILPEVGYILNTQSWRYLSADLSLKGINFWRKQSQDGLRLDVNPNIYFSYGRLLNLTQKVGLRETVYFLNEPEEYEDRFIYDLDTAVRTTLVKKYSNFVHAIEPSLSYTYIPHDDLAGVPFFDSIDSIDKTSRITYALTNRVSGLVSRTMETRLRLSQSYDILDSDKPFTPLLAEATMSVRDFDLTVNASYDMDDGDLTEFIGSARYKRQSGFIEVGKNQRLASGLEQYTLEAGLNHPIRLFNKSLPVELSGKVWYDAKNSDIQELNITSAYKKQCWAFSVAYNEQPDEYQVIFAVEFNGLGTFSLGSI